MFFITKRPGADIVKYLIIKKVLTNHETYIIIKAQRKRGNRMEWFFVGHIAAMGFGYDEYTNEDNTKCRQVWDDGYEEIFEIS